MRLCSIASGSSGNCIYVGSEEAHVLVDVGISGKSIEKGLNSLDLTGKDVDGILITHEHHDHFDTKAIAAIETPDTKIIANPNCQKMLDKGQAMKNGDILQITPEIKLEAVPAYNTTPGRDKFHPKGRDNGYILTVGDTRIYIAGDTEDIPEMKQIKNIDIAFLPVNQPYTMIPEQAIQSAKIIQPHILYPYHYGDTNINEVKDGLKNEKEIEVRIRALQ